MVDAALDVPISVNVEMVSYGGGSRKLRMWMDETIEAMKKTLAAGKGRGAGGEARSVHT